MNLIIGVHSIAHAIKNKNRELIRLVATEDGYNELKSRGGCNREELERVKCEIFSQAEFQKQADREFRKINHDSMRVPSSIFLLASELLDQDLNWLYDKAISESPMRIIALDQVTDVHNGAAIMRTAAFYGVKALLIPQRGSFGASPGFFRIASGATEHITIVRCASLSKAIDRLQEMGIICVGLSEHSTVDINELKDCGKTSTCLVLGAEDLGLSNSVSRVLKKTVALKPAGEIKSLNVSVASALAMNKIFGEG